MEHAKVLKSNTYNVSRFNNLPDIILADKNMRYDDKLAKALDKLAPIFIKHDVNRSWGLSLLHNHWKINFDELPVQSIKTKRSPAEFVSRPVVSRPSEVNPLILAVEKNSVSYLQPLEYSSDEAVLKANEELNLKPKFVQDFCKILIDNDFDSTFGLIAIKEVNLDYNLVEFNSSERESILRETIPYDVQEKKLIQTSWIFSNGVDGTSCTTKCASFCDVGENNHSTFHQTYHDPIELDIIEREREKREKKPDYTSEPK